MRKSTALLMLSALAALCSEARAQHGSVSIGMHQGAPALLVDGSPQFPMLFYQTVLTEKEPATVRQAGFRVFSFVGSDGVFGMNPGWTGENQYDYSQCDAVLQGFSQRVPDGYCIPRVLVSAPPWWLDKYPNEAVKFANGVGWKDNEWGGTKHESFASQRWRHDAGEALRRFVRHILQAPYADRIAGLHIAGGIYGEWHHWSATDLPDTSEPMRQALIRYVRDKYQDDLARLRKAYGQPDLTFETIAIPSQADQTTGDVGMFRDPTRRRAIVDYDECLHRVTLDAVEYFCRIVKEESKGRLLTMALYGYVPDLPWPQAGDHRCGPEALRGDAIDIFASPHTYNRRRLGQDGLFRHFPASVGLHGKLFLDEADDRTHLAPADWPGRFAPGMKSSKWIMRREFANALTRGAGLYYMDQSGTFFSDPELIAELGQIKKWADYAMRLPRASTAQVAAFSAGRSEFYLADRSSGKNHITQTLHDAQIGEICKSGAPFDWYHIDDLADGLVPPHRVYVFLDCFYLTPDQRAAINKLKSDGHTLLWFYAPGFVEEQRLSTEAMRSLTGLSFKQLPEGSLQIELDQQAFPDGPKQFGEAVTQSPVFEPSGFDAVWGRTTGTGLPALVSKQLKNWRSVYCLSPGIPATVLRRIFTDAGVHIYCPTDDNLSANTSWVCLHAATAGEKTIHLPQPKPVYDIFAEKLVSNEASEFKAQMRTGETRIWLLSNPADHVPLH